MEEYKEFYYLASFKMAAVKRAWFWKEFILIRKCFYANLIILSCTYFYLIHAISVYTYVSLSSTEDAIDAISYDTGSTDDSELLADITECLSSSSPMVRSTSAVSEWR